jgi:hypothetical protein
MIGSGLPALEAPAKEAALETHKLAIPDKPWALEIGLPAGFSVDGPKALDPEKLNGREVTVFDVAPKDGWHIMVSMEKVAADASARRARDEYGRKVTQGPLRIERTKSYERNGGAVWEHINKDPRLREMSTGKVAVSKSLAYFRLQDGSLIEVSLSKLGYRKSDQEYFDRMLDSLRIVPRELGS